MSSYILFDIGGTNMRLAISYDGCSISDYINVPTPVSFNEGLEILRTEIIKLNKTSELKSICGSIAGPLNKEKSMLVNSPHLSDWINKPLKARLNEIFNVPVFLENDAALEALGEFAAGSGKGYPIIAYLTLGTGLGGARIVNGNIDSNVLGFEPGHQIIQVDSSIREMESLISGASIEKRFGKLPSEIEDESIWEEITKYFAICIHNTICYWSPDIVILSGSMMAKINIDIINELLNKQSIIFPSLPKIVKSDLNNLNGFYGALYYLSQKI